MGTPSRFVAEFNKNHPPAQAPRDDTVDNYHGYEVPDPFRPLEDLDADATRKWTAAENARFKTFVANVDDIPEMKRFLKDIWEFPRESIPARYNDKYFSRYYDGKAPQPIYYVRDSLDGEPRVFIDANTLSADGTVAISGFTPSPDGKRVAYLTSEAGSDMQTLHIRDVATGKDLPDVIENCRFTNILWDRDSSRGFQYTYPADDDMKRFVARHHVIGDAVAKDKLVFELPGVADSFLNGYYLRDQDGNWGPHDFFSGQIGTNRSNSVYMKRRDSEEPYKLLFDDGKSSLDPIAEINGKIYAVTDRDAPKGKVVAIDPENPAPEHWQTIIPEHSQDVLKSARAHRGRLLVAYSHDTADRIAIHDLGGKHMHDVPLPEQSNVELGRINKDDTTLMMSISGFQSPGAQYKYDLAGNTLKLWKKSAAKVDLSDAIVERAYATSKDGTKVPMTIVRGKNVKLDGTAAVKMYGYGGFNSALGPSFSFDVYNWVKEGGIYVQTNLRGGGEFGADWYDQGRLANKQNVFDDFAACAEYLIKHKYTSPPRLAIKGGSNGGLLTLATALQRPELFGAVISGVPVTDMYRFHKHTYGALWKSDYGDPENSRADFEVSRRYSPLHNVRKGGKYPPILVQTADHDDRVVPSHAFKFAATFHDTAHPDSLCLMRVENKAGHGAGKPTEKIIEGLVDIHAFLEQTLGPINQEKYKEAVANSRRATPVKVSDNKHPRVNRGDDDDDKVAAVS